MVKLIDATGYFFSDSHQVEKGEEIVRKLVEELAVADRTDDTVPVVVGLGDYVNSRAAKRYYQTTRSTVADTLKFLEELVAADIPVYLYPGNHDISALKELPASYAARLKHCLLPKGEIEATLGELASHGIYVFPGHLKELPDYRYLSKRDKSRIKAELQRLILNGAKVDAYSGYGIIFIAHRIGPRDIKYAAKAAFNSGSDFALILRGHNHNLETKEPVKIYGPDENKGYDTSFEVPYLNIELKEVHGQKMPVYIIHPGIHGDYVRIRSSSHGIKVEYFRRAADDRPEDGGPGTLLPAAIIELIPWSPELYRIDFMGPKRQ